MNFETIPPHPQLASVREDLNRLKFTWGLCCASPILYLLFSQFVQDSFFSAKEMGFARLPKEQYQTVVGIAVAVVLALQVIMVLVRRRHDNEMRKSMKHPQQLVKIYSRRTFKLMLISEVAVILGFLLFLLNGHLWAPFAFGVATMLYYAQSYPSERNLTAFVREN